MESIYFQTIIDRAVNIANRAAVNNNPIDKILWSPPTTPSQDLQGTFIIVPKKITTITSCIY